MFDNIVLADDDDDIVVTSVSEPKPSRRVDAVGKEDFGPGILYKLGNEVARTEREVVGLAVRFLAGVCDGAMKHDGVGYNRLHAGLGHSLAETPVHMWTDRQAWAARKMLETYKNRQLAFMWPYMPELEPEPPRSDAEASKRESYAEYKRRTDPTWKPEPEFRELSLIERDGGSFVKLAQNYNPDLIAKIKMIPGRKYEGGTVRDPEKYWYVPLQLESLEALIEFSVSEGYTIPADVEQALEHAVERFRGAAALSRASSSDIELDVPDGLELFPFQKAGVEYALKQRNVLIADEMGLGKTVQALATVRQAQAFPVIVLCPASLKRNWEREAKKWLPNSRIGILSGMPTPLRNTKGDRVYDVVIIGFNSRVLGQWLIKLVEFGAATIIIDEAHNCKNESAAQTKLVLQLVQYSRNARILQLSGTPVVNRVKEFWTLIKILGRAQEMGGHKAFMERYDTTNRERLEELNTRARTHFMIRRLKRDVLPELPPKMYTVVPIEITNHVAYDKAERDIAGFFAQKHVEDFGFNKMIEEFADAKGLDGNHRAIFLKEARKEHFGNWYARAARSERLLRWEALKQLAVAGKMSGVIEWIDNFLEEGNQKLVIFADHTANIEYLAKHYNAEFIHGGVAVEKRMPIVDRFQTDPKMRILIGNMKAMGEGLTLTAASNCAFIEYGWNPKTHDQASDRLHRIGQHDSVMVWNLAAVRPSGEPTIDYELADMINRKRFLADAVQDGSDELTEQKMMDMLMEKLPKPKETEVIEAVGRVIDIAPQPAQLDSDDDELLALDWKQA